MYSVLMSNFQTGFTYIKDSLGKLINKDTRLVVIPWSFPIELESRNVREFFDDKKYNKYIEPLIGLGLNIENIKILDCYKDSKEYMINAIKDSSILILTGGNPEMFYNKVIQTGILECLKKYQKTIIGVSAGAELQLKKYFITKKNNYYKKFAWYDGFGIIDDDFYFDVHSINRGRYLSSLKNKSEQTKKDIYCLFDSGVIIYDRKTKKLNTYGEVVIFNRNRKLEL